MNAVKIPVQVKQVKDPDHNESLKATAPFRLMFDKGFDARWLNEELKKFEDKYLKLVDSLKGILKLIKARERKGKILLYWMFGDEIHEFMEHNRNGVLFLENPTAHLKRDTGISEKLISRCKKFRLHYPNISEIDLNRSFNSYTETFEGGYISANRRQKGSQKHA